MSRVGSDSCQYLADAKNQQGIPKAPIVPFHFALHESMTGHCDGSIIRSQGNNSVGPKPEARLTLTRKVANWEA